MSSCHGGADFQEIVLDVTTWQTNDHLGCLAPEGFSIIQGIHDGCALYGKRFTSLPRYRYHDGHDLPSITLSSTR